MSGMLIVRVIKGTDLLNCDLIGASDPLVRLCVGNPQTKKLKAHAQTEIIPDSLNPEWGEGDGTTLTAVVTKEIADTDPSVVLRIYDDDSKGDEEMGQVFIKLSEVKRVADESKEGNMYEDMEVTVNPNKKTIKLFTFGATKPAAQGTLTFEAKFVSGEFQEKRTCSGKLLVSDIKGADLLNIAYSGMADPFVALSIGDALSQKLKIIKKTTTMPDDLNPEYEGEVLQGKVTESLSKQDPSVVLSIWHEEGKIPSAMGQVSVKLSEVHVCACACAGLHVRTHNGMHRRACTGLHVRTHDEMHRRAPTRIDVHVDIPTVGARCRE